MLLDALARMRTGRSLPPGSLKNILQNILNARRPAKWQNRQNLAAMRWQCAGNALAMRWQCAGLRGQRAAIYRSI